MPPPKPAALFPEMVLEWMMVSGFPVKFPLGKNAMMPPPWPFWPLITWVARLFSTLLLVITMRASLLMAIPPPGPEDGLSTAELFWKVLLLMVAKPLLLWFRKLKMTRPPPPP